MNIVAEHIRSQLPEVGEGLAGQLTALSQEATPARCEHTLMNLRGAQQAVLRLRESLLREEGAREP